MRHETGLLLKGDIESGALFDRSGKFRYLLWRVWDEGLPSICFLLLNPSTADHERLDPTITRCFNMAKRWRFGAINIVNLFALRATNSAKLYSARDPIGPHNDRFIELAINASDALVLGWGNHGTLGDRHEEVLAFLDSEREIFCWGLTKLGQPRHPLYLRSDAPLIPFSQTDDRDSD